MELGYNSLFTIQIKLDASFSNDFYVLPVPSSASALNQHEMIFKQRNDGCLIAAGYLINDLGVAKNIRPVGQIEKFTFLLVLNNQGFYQQADLQPENNDSRIGRRFYYFSNLDNANTIDGKVTNGQALLSQNATVGPLDSWSVVPSNYQFFVDPTKYDEVELYKIAASKPDEKLPSVFKAGMSNASFIAQNNQSGTFQLRWKGTASRTENVYADNGIIKSNFFGLIEVYKDQNANSAILENHPVQYIIPFKNRHKRSINPKLKLSKYGIANRFKNPRRLCAGSAQFSAIHCTSPNCCPRVYWLYTASH